EQFVNRLYSMGLNDPLGIAISGESKPNIRHPKGKGYWSGTTIPWMSIGYGVEITPLQTLSFYATIANNGKRMRPYFVEAILDNGLMDKSFSPQVISPSICSNTTIDIVKDMLEGVVENGTARSIRNKQYKIAGKTGTNWIDYGTKTEDDRTKYQASFVGYFPADNPKYACIVVVNDPKENGSYGGDVAAPVFKAISDYVFTTDLELQKENRLEDLESPYSKDGSQEDLLAIFNTLEIPVTSADATAEWTLTYAKAEQVELKVRKISDDLVSNTMPNMVGMGLQDAIFLLENYGLKVNYLGKGSIKAQSIPKGNSIRKGQNITLELI
nr:PASTA domain-containing protein [Bacteroidota bacterium]